MSRVCVFGLVDKNSPRTFPWVGDGHPAERMRGLIDTTWRMPNWCCCTSSIFPCCSHPDYTRAHLLVAASFPRSYSRPRATPRIPKPRERPMNDRYHWSWQNPEEQMDRGSFQPGP